MNRFSQVIFVALMLVYLAPAQAMLNIGNGINLCQVFAEDEPEEGKDEGKEEEGKKTNGKKAGEKEPECD